MEKSKEICPTLTYTFFDSAINALQHLKNEDSEQPSIIFLDINMPLMDGWQFIEEYEQLPIEHAKVYILSTSLNPIDINKSEENATVLGFKQKPLSKHILEDICA